MQVWETDLTFSPKLADTLTICLGYFDGVHLGHQQLIKQAKNLGHPTALLTFDRNPKPGREQQSITPFPLKKRLLASLGIDHLIVVRFTPEVMSMTKGTFMNFLAAIGGKHLVCGPDFTFGFQATGQVNDLQTDGRFHVHVQPHLHIHQEKISTSTIVRALDQANLIEVETHLGRPYIIEGYVGKGLGEGKKMGYPTANIVMDAPFYLPKNGVYITLIKFDGHTYYSLASLGFHPTVANLDHPTLEVFVLNYQGNLYEKHVEVAFLHYLRPEQKFASKDSLVQQMNHDRDTALALQEKLRQDF